MGQRLICVFASKLWATMIQTGFGTTFWSSSVKQAGSQRLGGQQHEGGGGVTHRSVTGGARVPATNAQIHLMASCLLQSTPHAPAVALVKELFAIVFFIPVQSGSTSSSSPKPM